MQPVKREIKLNPRIGLNSSVIKEVSGGPISAKEVEMIEVGIEDSGIIEDEINLDRIDELVSLNKTYSIHGPYSSPKSKNMIDLGVRSKQNIKIMEKVFTAASYLDAEYIVVHGDKVSVNYREAFLNVVANLKELASRAKDHSIVLLIENLCNETRNDRIGILPHEIRSVLESVNAENLKFCFDVGHANLASHLYGFDILDFVSMLAPYLYHVHLHDNLGIPEVVDRRFGDQHLPLGKGRIDFCRVLLALEGTPLKNAILEIRSTCDPVDVLHNVDFLKEWKKRFVEINGTQAFKLVDRSVDPISSRR